jgi:hypothetical protein
VSPAGRCSVLEAAEPRGDARAFAYVRDPHRGFMCKAGEYAASHGEVLAAVKTAFEMAGI